MPFSFVSVFLSVIFLLYLHFTSPHGNACPGVPPQTIFPHPQTDMFLFQGCDRYSASPDRQLLWKPHGAHPEADQSKIRARLPIQEEVWRCLTP